MHICCKHVRAKVSAHTHSDMYGDQRLKLSVFLKQFETYSLTNLKLVVSAKSMPTQTPGFSCLHHKWP